MCKSLDSARHEHMAAPGFWPMRLMLPGFTPRARPCLSSTTPKAVFAVCLQLLVFAVSQRAWSITGLHNYSTITAAAPCAFNRRNISLISPQLSACSLYRNHTCNNCIMPSAAGVERPLVVHTLAVPWRYFPAGRCNDNLRSLGESMFLCSYFERMQFSVSEAHTLHCLGTKRPQHVKNGFPRTLSLSLDGLLFIQSF